MREHRNGVYNRAAYKPLSNVSSVNYLWHLSSAACILLLKNTAPLILSLDTATGYSSVAVIRGERVLAVCSGTEGTAHNRQVLGCVDKALRSAKLSLREIELLAATMGPGTFTGIRSGLATVKAFAATLMLPLAPIPTLHAVAIAEGETNKRIEVILPAGRKEVFAQTIMFGDDYSVIELNAARHVAPEVLFNQLDGSERNVLFVGAGARLYGNQLRERAQRLGCPVFVEQTDGNMSGEGGWRIAPVAQTPLAITVAKLAIKKLQRHEVVSAAEARALYVRPSDAELKKECQK